MKRFLLISAVLVFSTGAASGQGGSIMIFEDAAGTDCDIIDAGALVTVYFVHVHHTGATASQWMLDLGGLPWTHLGDLWNTATSIGTSISGVSLGYGACMSAPYTMGSANFFGTAAPACSIIQIVADPTAPTGQIEAVDCVLPSPNKNFPTGGAAIVNATTGCYCGFPPTPVETSTWGQVKAMYR